MGLDCIPYRYPCKVEGTAVLDDEGRIDCEATVAAKGCPWDREVAKRTMEGGEVYGIFGTYCWYRGKMGNAMIDTLFTHAAPEIQSRWGEVDEGFFYGDQLDEGTEDDPKPDATPEHLRAMAAVMRDTAEAYSMAIREAWPGEDEDTYRNGVDQWAYAAWWCDFVAEFGEGSTSWY